MAYYLVRVLNDHGAAYERDLSHPGGSESYSDYWTLARLSNIPMCEMSEVDVNSRDTYIFAPNNGNVQALLSQPRTCKAIHWELERPGTVLFPHFDEMWVSDKTQYAMAQALITPLLAEFGLPDKIKYVTMGGHKLLGGKPALPKIWDACPMCYAYGDRLAKIIDLATKGFTIAPSTFEPRERDAILAHSRWGFMLHQTPHPIMTPLRAVLYACWKLPIVAEAVGDSYPYKFIQYDPDLDILGLHSNETIQGLVDFNYRIATEEFTFKACIEAAL